MPEISGFEPNFCSQDKKENASPVEIIILRGIEDLSKKRAESLGILFGCKVVDLNYRETEGPNFQTDEWSVLKVNKTAEQLAQEKLERSIGLDVKMGRIDAVVQQAISEGKIPIIIGISAGAAMMEAYMIKHPDIIRHGYSLSGLLNPDLNNVYLQHLTSTSPGFLAVAEYLTENLTPATIERLHLPQKISAYNSPEDTIVSKNASHPPWIKIFHDMKSGDHVVAILKALITDIPAQIRELKSEAKFD